MKKLMILALLLTGAQLSAGVFGGISNLVTDAVQIPVDATTTAASIGTLGYYDNTYTLPRYVGGNEYGYQPVAYTNDVVYVD